MAALVCYVRGHQPYRSRIVLNFYDHRTQSYYGVVTPFIQQRSCLRCGKELL